MSEESDVGPADATGADEPAVNISGGDDGGGLEATFDPGTADTRAERIVDRLGELYWQKTYGGQDAFTCLVRTILSQNTSDVASQPAHDALLERYGPDDSAGDEGPAAGDAERTAGDARSDAGDAGSDRVEGGDGETESDRDGGSEAETESAADLATALAEADRDAIAETISSAGLYNQKSRMIQGAAEWVRAEFGSAADFDAHVKASDPKTVRDELLSVHGVGPKTADCVLLFAGGRDGVFPVDTHVHRISRRLGIAPADADHEGVREALEAAIPGGKCGFGHTATIQFGREYCTARKPACLDGLEACPLADQCDRIGVDLVDGTVVDPAEGD